jgi:glycosyltransferase involved in cell wall biosynthesis
LGRAATGATPVSHEGERFVIFKRISVVLTTFNRSELLHKAVSSVLGQVEVDLELVVVNDGSTDGTKSYLAGIADPRVVVVNRENGGLSSARNSGIAQASGDWITFLDDDDMALPHWLAGFRELVDDNAGIVCCGAEYRNRDGLLVSTVLPDSMGPLYEEQVGTRIAGTFAVRADLLREVEGYDERMTCSHQSELLMRLIPAMLSRGLQMRSTDKILLICESRSATDRPMSSPLALYRGTRILLDKHHGKLVQHPKNLAAYSGIVGVSAARLGLWSEARRAFLTAARAEPSRLRHWARLVAAMFPRVGRRVWDVTSYEEASA